MHNLSKPFAALGFLAALTLSAPALAEGNLAANGVDLPELKIDTADLTFSQNTFELETGQYYRLDITADDDAEDLAIVFPELFRNAWFNQIVVNGLEIKSADVYSLEFDGGGTFSISFVPIRPGNYDFWAPGYENKGLKGTFIVK